MQFHINKLFEYLIQNFFCCTVDRKYSEGFYSKGFGSVWVSNESRPEHFSKKWRSRYAKGEPNYSGSCLYLSSTRSYKWRDTSCERDKGVLCETNEVLCHGGNKGNSYFRIVTQFCTVFK